MHWQYTPYALALLIVAMVQFILIAYLWRRRETPGTTPFMLLLLALAEWCVTYAVELSSTDLAVKIVSGKFQYVGIVAIPALWLLFVLHHVRREKWLTRRTLILLCIHPVVFLLLLWTNEFHGLIRASISLAYDGSFVGLIVVPGTGFWIHAAYSYSIFLLACYILIRDLLYAETIYRTQVIALLIAVGAPWLANFLTIAGIVKTLDLTPFAFAITSVATAWALFRYRLLDLAPMARDIVIESMSNALVVLDMQGRVVDVNPAACAVVHKPASELIGRSIREIVPERADLINQYSTVLETRSEIVLGEGPAAQFYDLRISPIRDSRSHVVGRVVTLNDITDRKKIELILQQANGVLEERTRQLEIASAAAEEVSRLKSQFLSTMSHEVRTPLHAIMGFTDLLLTERMGSLNPKQRNYVERMAGNNKLLLRLINDFLDLARIEAGRVEVALVSYNPREMLNIVSEQSSSLFSQKSLKFTVDLDPALPETVTGDQDRVQQVVVNLLSNAAKFTQQGETTLSANVIDENNWQITVRDTGMGIAPEFQTVIFEPFRQVDGTSTRQFGGSGLGLAIVRELCGLMKGSIDLKSEVGVGSTFTVTLPRNTTGQKLPEKSLVGTPARQGG